MSRRGHGEGSIYRRRDGRWCAELSLGRGPDGRRRAWRAYGRTRREVADALAKAIDARRRGAVLHTENATLAAYLDDWLGRKQHKPKTAYEYGRLAASLLGHLGTVRLGRLDAAAVQRHYDALVAAGANPWSVSKLHALLHAALATAVKRRLIDRNPADYVVVPALVRRDRSRWTVEHARAFLAAARGHPDYPLWLLATATGARVGELLALRWSDVDFDAGVIRIARTVQAIPGAGQVYGPPKSAAGVRTVAVFAAAVDALRAQRAAVLAEMVRSRPRWHDEDLVFPSRRRPGSPQDEGAVADRFKRFCRAAGVPVIRFHDLRHFQGRALALLGVHPKAAQARLGHSRIAMTLDVYTAADPAADAAAAAQLGDLLAPGNWSTGQNPPASQQ